MKRSQGGYTLVELILYSVIALLVVGFSMSLIRSTSKSYTQDRSKSRMQTEGRNGILMMSREIINTGFKNYLRDDGGGVHTWVTIPNTTTADVDGELNPDGQSSFYYTDGDPYDELEIIKARLDDVGQHLQTERDRYYLSGTTLMRGERVHNGTTWDSETYIELTENVMALQYEFTDDNQNWENDFSAFPNSKRDVVAIKISMLLRTKKEIDMNVGNTYTLGNITFTPGAGNNYLHRLYVETVEVVNNGI